MSSKTSSRHIARWLFSHLLPYKKQVSIAIAALMLSSFAWLLLGQGIKYVIDDGFVARDKAALTLILSFVIGVVVIGSIATYFRFYWMVWLGERVCADIRKSLFSHLVTLSPHFFENTRTGEIISRFTSDTTLLQSVVGTGVSMALRSLVMFLGALVLMAITSLKLTLMVFVAVPLMLIPIRILGAKVREHSKLSQDKVAQVGGMVDESLHEIHTLQAYNHQHISSTLFTEKVEAVMDQARKRIHFRALLIAIVMIISLSAIFIVTFAGALMVMNNSVTVGELSAFVFYAVLAGGAIATISEVIGELQKAAGASERIVELMNTLSDIPDNGTKRELNPIMATSALRLESINFAYPSAPEKPVLQDISFTVNMGERIAVVGHSGAGKSTLFELIQRFHEVQAGQISIFDHPIADIALDELRAQFALVPQDAVIFSGTVNENIAFSQPEASHSEIMNAAKMAFADEFIQALPQGYQSELGERGVKLSGGQKQRIAIARAIVSQRPILLLDEATSALDASSEQYVKLALEQLMRHKTTIIIAHRLSTVISADKILVLDSGRIIASGTHSSLYESSDVYKEFVDLQLI